MRLRSVGRGLALVIALSGTALAQEAGRDRARAFGSPRYPAIPDAPLAAGTSIRAPGTRITNEGSAETAAGIAGSGPRRSQRRDVR